VGQVRANGAAPTRASPLLPGLGLYRCLVRYRNAGAAAAQAPDANHFAGIDKANLICQHSTMTALRAVRTTGPDCFSGRRTTELGPSKWIPQIGNSPVIVGRRDIRSDASV
jgi:hypothetical protein